MVLKVIVIGARKCAETVHSSNSMAVESSSVAIDHGFSPRKFKTTCPSANEINIKEEKLDPTETSENEILRIFQALLLSTCMLLLNYHSVRYGRTEYSILENGEIASGYAHKAVITLTLGYSMPYTIVSFFAIGMLAYSLISKNPRWSLPSIVLYLADLVCGISEAIVAIWLFFSYFPLSTALSYTLGTILLIFGEIWMWLGVLRLYEHRTFK
ncbi:uncharacterized protein LOC132913114 isoform X2 [Bombus pascuorum]|uniref:uncharacterized protein LOC132913114 isoform X2 n=1 Tax=Bombus pascuorum TaxID=65598 RepID=UPI00298DBC70|nr:uncharacterized protein LOC132913114 isoform X2 [Bombus pascuorum]